MDDGVVTDSRRVTPLSNPRLVDSAMEAIRGAILAGRFAPGERLLEMQLATELGISRGPLREALQLLEKDGIIYSIPRRGTFVQTFDLQAVDEVYSLRKVLEVFAVVRAMEHIQSNGYEKLASVYQRMRDAADAGDEVLLLRHDIAFHRALIELAGHELLRRAWLENIDGRLQMLLTYTTRTHHPMPDALAQHQHMLDVAQTGDSSLMQEVMQQHIEEAWGRARNAVQLRLQAHP